MGYGNKSLNDLRDEAHRNAVEHGFDKASFGERIALMHSELSEALEDYRKGCKPNQGWYEEKTEEGVVVHRAMFDRSTGEYGIDIEQAVREKMLFNMTRPFKHGGKKL